MSGFKRWSVKGLIAGSKGQFAYLARLLVEIYRQFWARDCQQSAASLTYVTLFALVPTLTLVYSMFSLFPTSAGLQTQVQNLIFDNLVPTSGQVVQDYLTQFTARARNLSVPGAIMLVVTAYLMLKNIEKTFNKIWGVSKQRSGLNSFLNYWAVLTLGPVLLGAGLFLSTYLLSLRVMLPEDDYVVPGLLQFLPWLLSSAAFTLFFAVVPNLRVPVRDAIIGGMVTALLFELAKRGFSALVTRSSYELIYGAFAIVPLFLLWIYVLWVLVLGGAVLVRCLSSLRIAANSRGYPDLVAATVVMVALTRAMRGGEGLRDSQVFDLGVFPEQWHLLKSKLLAERLIVDTQANTVVLARSHAEITLNQIAHAVDDHRFRARGLSFPGDGHWAEALINRLEACDQDRHEHLEISLATLTKFEATDKAAAATIAAEDSTLRSV